MYILTSPDEPTIITHATNTLILADVVKSYIENGHNCTIKIEEYDGKCKVFYDRIGMKLISDKIYNVVCGEVEVGIDNIDSLEIFFEEANPSFEKGFMRIRSFHCNLCLTEKEFLDTKKWFEDNAEKVLKYIEEYDAIVDGIIKK